MFFNIGGPLNRLRHRDHFSQHVAAILRNEKAVKGQIRRHILVLPRSAVGLPGPAPATERFLELHPSDLVPRPLSSPACQWSVSALTRRVHSIPVFKELSALARITSAPNASGREYASAPAQTHMPLLCSCCTPSYPISADTLLPEGGRGYKLVQQRPRSVSEPDRCGATRMKGTAVSGLDGSRCPCRQYSEREPGSPGGAIAHTRL
jgi:hypothetical protein